MIYVKDVIHTYFSTERSIEMKLFFEIYERVFYVQS